MTFSIEGATAEEQDAVSSRSSEKREHDSCLFKGALSKSKAVPQSGSAINTPRVLLPWCSSGEPQERVEGGDDGAEPRLM